MFNRAKSVGNNNQCLVPAEGLNGVANQAFCLVIKGGGGFIQDKNLPIVLERPCNPDPLPLSARESHSPLSDHGVNALG